MATHSSSIRVLLTSVSVVALVAFGAVAPGAQARYEPGRSDGYQTYPGDYSSDRYDSYDLPAFVSVVDGYVELDRAGQSARDIENVPLEAGDRLRTTRGRAEVLFDDGSVIALDEHTTVEFGSATDVELLRGRVRAQWQHRGTLAGLTVHTMAGRAIVLTRGDYRVTLGEARNGEAEIELAVARGSAELANDLGRTLVREGTRALTTATYAPSVPYALSAPRDEFERWTDSLESDRYGVESVRYLPTELRYYGGVFDRYGSWHNHASYGWVWYPRVSAGWRPYDGGRWTFVVGFGYSWVGGSRWGWPTHHHGRWDRVGSRYFWIPLRPQQRRVVGYAVPRPSYTAAVNYYQRPANYPRPTSTIRGSQSPGRPQTVGRPQSAPSRTAPVAVPRNPAPAIRGGSSAPERGSQPVFRSPQQAPQQAPTRTAPTSTRGSRPADRSSQPEARAPQSSRPGPSIPSRAEPRSPRAEPEPSRSRPAPPAASAPPPSGSRTPSRTAPPSGSGGGRQGGTAVRRPSGGG